MRPGSFFGWMAGGFAIQGIARAPRFNTTLALSPRVNMLTFDPITASARFERVDLVAVRTIKPRRKGADAVIGSKFNFKSRATR
jgi:hypothetical protein